MKENNSNYSHLTSKPAYLENKVISKDRQCDALFKLIKHGANNLLQLSQLSGIPQAVCSARMDDLKKENRASYSGHVIYENRLRKKIKIIEQVIPTGKQAELFERL